MRVVLASILILAAGPGLAQRAGQPQKAAIPAASRPSEQLGSDKEAAEKKATERKAAADRAASDKARLALDAKIDAADRKMRRAMERICSGCLTKTTRSR